jgi:hypothetical protein
MRKSIFGTAMASRRRHLTGLRVSWRCHFLRCDHRLKAGVHRELKYIRTCVVPSHIKFPLCRPQLYVINLRIQDAFLFAQWPSDEFTVRVHNRTVTNVDPLIDIRLIGLLEGISIRNIAFSLDDAASNDKDSPFYCDVTESR